jgi:hypothetical protein
MQPASREQIVAIIRQRAERRDAAANAQHAQRERLHQRFRADNPPGDNAWPPPPAGANQAQAAPIRVVRPEDAPEVNIAGAAVPVAAVVQADAVNAVPARRGFPQGEIFQELMAGAFPPLPLPGLQQPGPPPPPHGLIIDHLEAIRAHIANAEGRVPMMDRAVPNFFRQASISREEEAPRLRNLSHNGSVLAYKAEPDYPDAPGVYVCGKVLR